MKIKENHVQACVCGHGESVKSFYSRFDIYLGLAITAILLIVLALFARDILILPFLLILMVYIPLLTIRIFKRHSLKCSSSWAFKVIFGSIGGFGVFSF
jgi:hypothetical protein